MLQLGDHLDFQQYEARNMLFHIESGAPANPFEGQVYYNSTAKLAYIWNSSAWKPLSGTFDHTELTNKGIYTHAQIDTHIDDQTNPHNVTAAQTGAIPTTEKAAQNGVAPLDSSGKVPLVHLPAGAKSGRLVEDITARNGIASSDRYEAMRVDVLDASDDPTVESGMARYVLKQPLTNSDWIKTSEGESMDIDFSVYVQKANNLSDLPDAGDARNNLGLGSAAQKDAGAATGNVPVNAEDLTGHTDDFVMLDINGALKPVSKSAALPELSNVISKQAFTVGNGSNTSFTLNHGKNTRDVTVQVYANASPYNEIITTVERPDTNNVTVKFAVAPTADQYRVIVI